MSEQPEPSSPQRQRLRPPSGSSPEGEARNAYAQLRNSQSLERLRERIQTAAHEIHRLREENTALAERIARLEAAPEADEAAGAVLRLDEDPEALRRKVSGFIEAIDAYLKREQP